MKKFILWSIICSTIAVLGFIGCCESCEDVDCSLSTSIYDACIAPGYVNVLSLDELAGTITLEWEDVSDNYQLLYVDPTGIETISLNDSSSMTINISNSSGVHQFTIYSECIPSDDCCDPIFIQGSTLQVLNEDTAAECNEVITGISIDGVTEDAISINWDENLDIASYEIEITTPDGILLQLIETDQNETETSGFTSFDYPCIIVWVKGVCGDGTNTASYGVVIATLDDVNGIECPPICQSICLKKTCHVALRDSLTTTLYRLDDFKNTFCGKCPE